jgi:hypothetical protein
MDRFPISRVGRTTGLVVLLLLAGCQAPRPLYYWGNYEAVLYVDYSKPGKLSVEDQIAKLEEDLRTAKGKGYPAHPGLHAQIGYLYFQKGNVGAARREFEAEKAVYPESVVFMDRLLAKLGDAAK